MALSLIVLLSLARETSPGHYVMRGKSGSVPITEARNEKFMVVVVILSIIFAALGFWFRAKQIEKESVLQNADHPMR